MSLSESLAELPTLDEVRQERARRSLGAFTTRMLGLEPARHHLFVNGKLEAVERGEIPRLMLFEPPGHAKSTYASHLFPAWYLGRNPRKSVIAASYTAQLATKFGRRVRNLFDLKEWPFTAVALAADSKAADQWETVQGGEYFAAGVGGGIAGRRANLAVIDDPIKGRKDADMELAETLVTDLLAYDPQPMTRGLDLRGGRNSDLVHALAVALWWADDLTWGDWPSMGRPRGNPGPNAWMGM